MTGQKPKQDDGWTASAWWMDLHAAIATLTRLPVNPPPAVTALSPRVRRAYPLVGAFTGLAAGGVFFAANDVGLPIAVNAVLAVAALILIGGHMDDHGNRAAAPLLVATLFKISAIYVIASPATPGGSPHMVVLALVATGALSHAAAILLEPGANDDPETTPANAYADPKVVIMPPDGTQIAEEDLEEGNGTDLGAPATAIIIALLLTVITLGLLPGAVAAAGATIGAWLAPRILMRELEAETLPVPLALQQTAEVWALLGLAIFMSI